ncbi:kinase-like domain-containing protein [Mycena rebaudengoi]|nr:kinase-like domain-containing protein [Mycena rebaudengoi]
MHLAGDCCVALVGRVFHNSAVIGFCMPIETPIDAARISTIEERIRIIHKLKHLVATLHSRNIVHGDIKPENLLVCADGSLRLCDFDGASVEGDGYATAVLSLPYCSPSRFQGNGPAVPMTRAEDIYAMGMTMWEIYTGRTPLIDIGESFTTEELIDCLEHRVNAGFLPDMQLIDDLEIAALIQECLDAAPECSDGIVQDKIYCIATWFAFGHCKVQPRHSYSRTVHSWQCHQAWPDHDKDVPCADFFLQPKILTGREEPTCPKCVKSVVFAGLAG